jgi:hypothetical protein
MRHALPRRHLFDHLVEDCAAAQRSAFDYFWAPRGILAPELLVFCVNFASDWGGIVKVF